MRSEFVAKVAESEWVKKNITGKAITLQLQVKKTRIHIKIFLEVRCLERICCNLYLIVHFLDFSWFRSVFASSKPVRHIPGLNQLPDLDWFNKFYVNIIRF